MLKTEEGIMAGDRTVWKTIRRLRKWKKTQSVPIAEGKWTP